MASHKSVRTSKQSVRDARNKKALVTKRSFGEETVYSLACGFGSVGSCRLRLTRPYRHFT